MLKLEDNKHKTTNPRSDPSTQNPTALVPQLGSILRLFNSNYSGIMLQSSGHLATERPFSLFLLANFIF